MSCVYDADDRCDANQHVSDAETCLCNEGFVMRAQRCVTCGENETISGGNCVCNEGFARSGAGDGPCVPSGLGQACDLADPNSCADATYNICRDHGGGIGYCTQPCAADSDCQHGYACDTDSTPTSCKSSPTGQLEACSSGDDCADKDATYCETVVAGACLVQGCSPDAPLSCSEGFTCCDLNSLGYELTLCVPEGECITAP